MSPGILNQTVPENPSNKRIDLSIIGAAICLYNLIVAQKLWASSAFPDILFSTHEDGSTF
jgi:hypothetical protein